MIKKKMYIVQYKKDLTLRSNKLNQLLTNIRVQFPDLYRYMMKDAESDKMSVQHRELKKFMIKHAFDYYDHLYFNNIQVFEQAWDYLAENEDKHEWWML